MQFRSIGQRDDRRRRMFGDGQWGATANTGRRPARSLGWDRPVRKSENYGDAEFLDHLPRAIDLVPTRFPTLLLLFLLGLGTVVGLEVLYYWMPVNIMAANGRVDAFDLACKSNLAVWFSSMSLVLSGLLALVVFSVRRHRTDDYHGHYRVWLWTALCCFLFSMEQTANLRTGLSQMATRLTGTPLYGDGSLWWLLAYVFLFGAVGTRLLVDVIANRLSTVALVGAVACYVLWGACQFRFVALREDVWQVMVATGSQLLGNLLILSTIGFHVRHVLLDAGGFLARRKPKLVSVPVDEEEDPESAESEPEEEVAGHTPPKVETPSIIVHPPQGIPRPMGGAMTTTPPPHTGPPTSIAEAEATLKRKLTKTERKALRQRLEKLQADRQKRAG